MSYASSDFLAVFAEITQEHLKARHKGPSSLLDAWESMIEDAEDGYDESVDEYLNDLSVRYIIEQLCMDERVMNSPTRNEFYSRVIGLDARFGTLLQPEVQIGSEDSPWWARGVLHYSGGEYAQEMKSVHKIDVDFI